MKPLFLFSLHTKGICHMDYFKDVLITFLGLERVSCVAVYGRVRELSDSIKNILICVLKTLQVWNDMRLSN